MSDTFFLSILTGYDTLFKALLIFIVLDYLSGVMRAFYTGKLSSKVGAKGIIKKIGYIILVILVEILDILLKDNGYLRNIVIYMFIANEGISILENWAKMGIKIPEFLKERFGDLKNNEDINVTKTVEDNKDSKKDRN